MVAAKGAWSVQAGVLPGHSEPEFALVLGYTSSDYEKDSEPGDSETIFIKQRNQVLEHAKKLMDPRRVNWVTVHFTWF